MVQARIEPSPAEQLRELRKARDRYAALAEQLHDSADPELDPDEKLARERNARRILRSYEKSISNSVVRMSSMDKTHRFARPSLGMRAWLVIFVAISVLEGGMLLGYFRPEIFKLLMPQKTAAKAERIASVTPIKVAPTPIAAPPAPASAAPDVLPPRIEAPKPIIRPSAPPPVAIAPGAATPPQLVLIAPPPVDAPPMPVIVLEPLPTAQSAPPPVSTAPVMPPPAPVTSAPVAPQTPPPVATAQPASPPPAAAAPAPPQQPAPRAATLIRPEAIAATHTRPPYPVEAKRLGQAGATRMRLTISPLGAASVCEIVKSAGSDQLDAAACTYVQRVWRWKAATQDGQPVTASTEVTIVWNLLTAR